MKKLAWISLLLAMSTGCGRGWSPFYRGAPCNNQCLGAAPALPAGVPGGCNGCGAGAAAGYGSYENEIVDGGYYDGGIVHDGVIGGGTYGSGVAGDSIMSGGIINSPSMSTLPRATPAP